MANDNNFHEGRYWTYNTAKALKELFPFWSIHQIKRIIKKLEERELILLGNFNKSSFDRTNWYALSDEILRIYEMENVQVQQNETAHHDRAKPHFEKERNRTLTLSEIAPTIPDTNTDIIPDSKKDTNVSKKELPPICQTEEWKGFVEMRKKIKSPLSERAVTLAINRLGILAPDDLETQKAILDQSTMSCWKGLFVLKGEGSNAGNNRKHTSTYARGSETNDTEDDKPKLGIVL